MSESKGLEQYKRRRSGGAKSTDRQGEANELRNQLARLAEQSKRAGYRNTEVAHLAPLSGSGFVSAADELNLASVFGRDGVVEKLRRLRRRGLSGHWAIGNTMVFGPAPLLEGLAPVLPRNRYCYHHPTEIQRREVKPRPARAIVCAAGPAEDQLYTELAAAFRSLGWQDVPIYRFFGDVVTNALVGMDPLYGPHSRIDVDWDRFTFYAIVAPGRCGSTYLCDLLQNTGVCGNPTEYLRGPLVYCLLHDLIDVDQFMRRLIVHHASPNGVFGIKVVPRYLLPVTSQVSLQGLQPFLPKMRIIFLKRHDKIAQTASALRARKTGRWHSMKNSADPTTAERLPSTETLTFTEEDLRIGLELYDLFALYQDQLDSLVAELFDQRQIITLNYEDLIEDPRLALRRIIHHIGIEGVEANMPIKSRHLKIIANDDLNERLAEALGVQCPAAE